MADLARHAWPGNVRELRNYVERCLAMREALPPGDGSAGPVEAVRTEGALQVTAEGAFRETRDRFVSDFERAYLTDLVRRHAGNIAAASCQAGIDRAYLYRMLWKHGLK